MIKIRIKNNDNETDIRFPISESEMFAKLGEISMPSKAEMPHSPLSSQKSIGRKNFLC